MRLTFRHGLAFVGWCGLGACSGGYPLAPTPCDEYCDATNGDNCPEYYNPAGCVSNCEQARQAPTECRAELDGVIACYKQHPEALSSTCSFGEPSTVCVPARVALSCCATRAPYACAPPPSL